MNGRNLLFKIQNPVQIPYFYHVCNDYREAVIGRMLPPTMLIKYLEKKRICIAVCKTWREVYSIKVKWKYNVEWQVVSSGVLDFSRIACGMKLSRDRILRYSLMDCSRHNSLWLGLLGSLIILLSTLLGLVVRPGWLHPSESLPPVEPYGWERCNCHTRQWCSCSGYCQWCTCRSCRVSWDPCWTSKACEGRRAAALQCLW